MSLAASKLNNYVRRWNFVTLVIMQKKTEAKTETVKVAVGIAKWWQLYAEAKVL